MPKIEMCKLLYKKSENRKKIREKKNVKDDREQ